MPRSSAASCSAPTRSRRVLRRVLRAGPQGPQADQGRLRPGFRRLRRCPGPETSPTAAFALGRKADDPLAMYLSDIYRDQTNPPPGASPSPSARERQTSNVGVRVLAPAGRTGHVRIARDRGARAVRTRRTTALEEEVGQRAVEDVGGLPLEEVAGARDLERADAVGERDLATLGKSRGITWSSGPYSTSVGTGLVSEEARHLGRRPRAQRGLVDAEARAACPDPRRARS